MAKSHINFSVDKAARDAAKRVLDSMGLDMSTALRMCVYQIAADKGLPFRPRTGGAQPIRDVDQQLEQLR